MPMILNNGHKCCAMFAVVRGAGKCLILGRPFLKDVCAIISHHSAVMSTPSGPILLLEGYASGEVEVSEVNTHPPLPVGHLDQHHV